MGKSISLLLIATLVAFTSLSAQSTRVKSPVKKATSRTAVTNAKKPQAKKAKTTRATAPKMVMTSTEANDIQVPKTKYNVTVDGIVIGLKSDSVFLLDGTNNKILAKAKGRGNLFTFYLNTRPGDGKLYKLAVPTIDKSGDKYETTPYLFIDNRKVSITAEIVKDKLNILTCNPSVTINEFKKLKDANTELDNYMKAQIDYDNEVEAYSRSTEESKIKTDQIQTSYKRMTAIRKNVFQKFEEMIPSNIQSEALLALLFKYNICKTASDSKIWLDKFDPSMKDKYYGRFITKYADYEYNSQIGKIAPDFSLYNKDRRIVKLSELRGKYVILNFWMTWSDFSNNEYERLVKIAAQHSDKVEVVGVCIYSDNKDWKNKLQELRPNFIQLIDEGNVTPIRYQFTHTPFLVLISPEGLILKRDIRGEDINKSLRELGI
jgi:hypothetical protein